MTRLEASELTEMRIALELLALDSAIDAFGADDETAVRVASRAATLKGIRTAKEGRDPAATQALVDRRDNVTSPFYSGS